MRKPIKAESISDIVCFGYMHNWCKLEEVRELEAYTTELEQRIEAMKCCGNCENHNYGSLCINCNSGYSAPLKENGLACCDNWQIKEG